MPPTNCLVILHVPFVTVILKVSCNSDSINIYDQIFILSLVLEIESRGLNILKICPAFLVHSKQLPFKILDIQQVVS